MSFLTSSWTFWFWLTKQKQTQVGSRPLKPPNFPASLFQFSSPSRCQLQDCGSLWAVLSLSEPANRASRWSHCTGPNCNRKIWADQRVTSTWMLTEGECFVAWLVSDHVPGCQYTCVRLSTHVTLFWKHIHSDGWVCSYFISEQWVVNSCSLPALCLSRQMFWQLNKMADPRLLA